MMVGDVTNVTLFSLTVACHCATIVRGIVQPSRRHLDHEEEDEEEKHRQPSFYQSFSCNARVRLSFMWKHKKALQGLAGFQLSFSAFLQCQGFKFYGGICKQLNRAVKKALFGFIPADYPLGQGFKSDEATWCCPKEVSRMLCGAQQDIHGEAVVMWWW